MTNLRSTGPSFGSNTKTASPFAVSSAMHRPRGPKRSRPINVRRLVLVVVSLAVVVGAIVVAAVRSPGADATNVQLDDGVVWVTNPDKDLVGRLNLKINEFDMALNGAKERLDVVQDGRTVFFASANDGVQRMDVVSGQVAGENHIPIELYKIGGGVGAVYDPQTGNLWTGPAPQFVGADFPDKPDAVVNTGGRLIVTTAVPQTVIPGVNDKAELPPRGRVIIVEGSAWYEVALDADLKPIPEGADKPAPSVPSSTPTTTSTTVADDAAPDTPPPPVFPLVHYPTGLSGATIDDVTAVGGHIVMLGTTKQNTIEVAFDGHVATVPGTIGRLQQVGADTRFVVVQTDLGLFSVSLDEDATVTQLVEASGRPSQPVRVGSCEYGAWSSEQPVYARRCDDGSARGPEPIAGAQPNAELIWRVNQLNVALNSATGDVWADHDGSLANVGNWSDVEPENQEQNDLIETVGESPVVVESKCIEGGEQLPLVGDDTVGVRPRQSILDVLPNDKDPNCEPIAITQITPQSGDWGALTIVNSGQNILYSPSDASLNASRTQAQSFQFTYMVQDLAGNLSPTPATVTVSMKDMPVGESPPQLRPKDENSAVEMKTVVEEGQSVSYDVLADWIDADGDDLRVVNATAQSDGEVSSTSAGLVKFSAAGVAPGNYKVDVTVSDGVQETTAPMSVLVKSAGSVIPPITNNDFVTIPVGTSATVSPLANDLDPNEDPLTFEPQWDSSMTALQMKPVGNDVEIIAITPGTYNLVYGASDGGQTTKGVIRVVAVGPGEANSAPIAVPDQAKLRADRIVNVDVLANDVDVDGDTLAITNVEVPDSDPNRGIVRASVVDRRMVQLEITPGPTGEPPTGPFTVSYTISDGHEQDRVALNLGDEANARDAALRRGAVTILVQPPTQDDPPILVGDQLVVRTGDVASVNVLNNDVDPDADEITLIDVDANQQAEWEASGQGVVWVKGRDVYVRGGKPGRYSILYTAQAGDRTASAEVSVLVQPAMDPAQNPDIPPEPRDLELRAVRGSTVRLRVPLTGVDPDGDSVVLSGDSISSANAGAGNRVDRDPDHPDVLLFTASPTSPPTDTFTYTVSDVYGLSAAATVHVMVIDDPGWAPQAHDDVWRGKPGRVLSIPVVANDTSPQDRPLEIAKEPYFDNQGVPTVVPVNGEAVRLLDQADPATRGRVEVTVPTSQVTLSEHYRISDGFNPSDAFIRVTADPDAPNMRPIALPDSVNTDDVENLSAGDIVPVDVLANDYDPDDAGTPLQFSVPAGENATFNGSQLEVPLRAQPQLVLYRITDADGLSAVGMVRVAGRENHPPTLSDIGRDANARTIKAGDARVPIAIADITTDPDGDPIALTDTEVRVLGGVGEVVREGDGFTYIPPQSLTVATNVSIQFEVTDRPEFSPEDRQKPGCNCLSTLVVEVVILASSPPRIVSAGAVQVPQLHEPVSYDVAPLSVDDDGDALTYSFDNSTFGGLDVQVNGSKITVTSNQTGSALKKPGDRVTIQYTVSDGIFEPISNTVTVTIVATNKGRPATASLGPYEAVRDESLRIPANLLDSSVNPFASDGEPLTLVNATVNEPGELKCSDSGDCTFVSHSTDVRAYTVNYTIRDAVDQTANGSFEITMKGKPLAPGIPKIESVGDHVVNISWTDADLQGGSLVTYHVTVVETGETRPFTQTSGAVDGLANAREYHFTVAAENELGVGETSGSSSAGIPDRVPDPPVALAIPDYHDQSLTLTWQAPPTVGDFSAITTYEVSIGGQTLTVDGGVNSLVVGNGGQGNPLANGTDYTFRVRARNSAKVNNGWGEWSVQSASQRPSRYPDKPTGVKAVNSGDGGSPRLTVTWNAPGFDGGRPIEQYKVCEVGGSCKTIKAPTTTATFDKPGGRNTSSSFTVEAFNNDKNRNNSEVSDKSPAVVVVGNPDAPVLGAVTSDNHKLVVAFTPKNNSGCDSATTEFSINGGDWTSSATFTGLTNGKEYSIRARTRLASSCGTKGESYVSPDSNVVKGTPYGPLVAPTIKASGGGTTTITWTWNTNRADDGRPSWKAVLSGECGNDNVTAKATGTVENSYKRGSGKVGCTITVSADGVTAKSDSASATVQTEPKPQVSDTRGSRYIGTDQCAAGVTNCSRVVVTGTDFEPKSPITYQCGENGPIRKTSLAGNPINTDAKGNFGPVELTCFHGTGVDWQLTIVFHDTVRSKSYVSEF